MRKIEYILIDSDTESHDSKYGRRHVPDSRYHFCVNREGLVINGADIRQSVNSKPSFIASWLPT